MNKKLNNYKKKFDRIIKTIKIIGISILLLGILISIVQYTINKSKTDTEDAKLDSTSSDYVINIQNNTVVYESELKINLEIIEFDANSNYKMNIKLDENSINEQEIIAQESSFLLEFENEGKKNIDVEIYKNNEINFKKSLTIYYIIPYEKQFLDELTNKGINVHYRETSTIEDYSKSLALIEKTGIKNIRNTILYSNIFKNNNYNFSYYDKWIEEASNKGINVLLIIGGFNDVINTDEKVSKYIDFAEIIMKRYPQITNYEILNEPNFNTYDYITDEEIKYYTELVKGTKKLAQNINKKIKIMSGSVANASSTTNTYISAQDFLDKLTENSGYYYSNGYSYHPYSNSLPAKQEYYMKNYLKNYKSWFNQYGGFLRRYVTEYGVTMITDVTEELQAKKLLQQTVLMDYYDEDLSYIYNFWNKGTEENNKEYNFGIVNNDFTPKLSYYTMKNYYQNTNGSEYIGNLAIQEGLETHVYNKDGKPIVIAWSDNTDNTYNFTLNQMTAKDLYGKDIVPNQTNQIQITTSPVYIYNADTNYFYQAISNTAATKYDEFTQKFADQISAVPNLQTTIETLKQNIQTISGISTLSETTAISLMEQHYNLGTTLIQAYKSRTLQIEYVTLSSMLDMLDDIGDSFEDLVTVSATTRNANLPETLNTITTAQNKINDQDIEMIYPTKILEFSQDFYDTANYINSLEEENDIKTGLIVSKNLHSKLLADWASKFADLYIEEYIANNPVTITYSTTELTSQDVTATLQTNANITVTNNENSKTYTFNRNDTFTFEYTIKGQAKTITATVNNIDKTAPTITDVQNDKLYLNNVTPKIQDTNLKEVELYKEGNKVTNYQANSTITEDGNYKIIATDKAGNQSQVEFYISRNPASITYSETNWTNKDVIATITSNFEVEVTNNNKSISHTFTKNESFEFVLKIKQTEVKITATVNNIDKTPPTVTGVENNRQYLTKATPVITDDNLQEIKLYLNDELVNNYKSNTELTEEGFYKIIATDKAGNTTTVEFIVIENLTKEYKIKENYIVNIENNTNKDEFKQKLNIANQYEIQRNGNNISNTDLIATGDTLKMQDGREYTLIVNGDINKDGKLNIKDLIKLRIYLVKRDNLDQFELMAADCNLDERPINIKDLIKMRILLVQRDEI